MASGLPAPKGKTALADHPLSIWLSKPSEARFRLPTDDDGWASHIGFPRLSSAVGVEEVTLNQHAVRRPHRRPRATVGRSRMPRDKMDRESKARGKRHKPVHSLRRQIRQDSASQPTMIARERIVHQLTDLIAACEELFHEHGEACSCDACCAVSNMTGSLRIFRMLLEIT